MEPLISEAEKNEVKVEKLIDLDEENQSPRRKMTQKNKKEAKTSLSKADHMSSRKKPSAGRCSTATFISNGLKHKQQEGGQQKKTSQYEKGSAKENNSKGDRKICHFKKSTSSYPKKSSSKPKPEQNNAVPPSPVLTPAGNYYQSSPPSYNNDSPTSTMKSFKVGDFFRCLKTPESQHHLAPWSPELDKKCSSEEPLKIEPVSGEIFGVKDLTKYKTELCRSYQYNRQ